MSLLSKSDWIMFGILALMFILYWLVFGTAALKYLIT